jgi:predicted RNase H-like HicB family nuclease
LEIATMDAVTSLIRAAIELHIESLRAHGEPVPSPTTAVRLVEVA